MEVKLQEQASKPRSYASLKLCHVTQRLGIAATGAPEIASYFQT